MKFSFQSYNEGLHGAWFPLKWHLCLGHDQRAGQFKKHRDGQRFSLCTGTFLGVKGSSEMWCQPQQLDRFIRISVETRDTGRPQDFIYAVQEEKKPLASYLWMHFGAPVRNPGSRITAQHVMIGDALILFTGEVKSH